MEHSKSIYGNIISDKQYKKALKAKQKMVNKFSDDTDKIYHLKLVNNPILDSIGCLKLEMSNDDTPLDLSNVKNPLIVGNIRMGFGHYRISLAIASCAKALGYTPLWLDLNSFNETSMTKIIESQNQLYSMGSRLSAKSKLFNKLFWEPLNYEGFRQLSQNVNDQKVAELFTPIFCDIYKNIPFIATHVWPSQAAIHAGMKNVVNAIPDNWQMALHLSEGAISTIQMPNSYFGYKTLRGMNKNNILNPMPKGSIYEVGHFIDHELIKTLEETNNNRIKRINEGKPLRYLLTVGGAGSQFDLFSKTIKELIPLVNKNKAVLYINVGDHKNILDNLLKTIPELNNSNNQFNDYEEVKRFSLNEENNGIHLFYSSDIFEAVYFTNLLMNISDILVTKPSELAFYPIPKLFIPRVGGHEKWGAIHSAEIGDGTYECKNIDEVKNFIHLFDKEPSIISFMAEKIIKNNKIGIYDGGYNSVKILDNKIKEN